MEQRDVPAQISPGLQWKIEEIPGEDGWWRQSSHVEFEEIALFLVQAGISEKTVAAMLSRIYWAVAYCYGE